MFRIPPPVVTFAFASLAWAMARQWPVYRFDLPLQKLIASLLAISGLGLALIAVREFARIQTTVNPIHIEKATALATSGPFSFSRNPMYLGMLLVLVGVCVWLGSVPGLVAPLLYAGYITWFQIIPEERVMRRKFGDVFTDYAARTRRWF